MTPDPHTEPRTLRPTAHTFEQINWNNAESETRIGVLQEMVAILLNRLDEAEASTGADAAAPSSEAVEARLPSATDLDVAADLLYKVANGATFGPTTRSLARRLAYHLNGQREPAHPGATASSSEGDAEGPETEIGPRNA